VIVVLVLLLAALASAMQISPTGHQVLDLPNPPPVPDTDNDQLLPNTTSATVPVPVNNEFDTRLRSLETRFLAFEDRLLIMESQFSQIPAVLSRLDSLQQQVDGLRGDVETLRNQPVPEVESPVSFDALTSLRDSSQSWFTWSLSVALLALLGVMGIVGTSVYQRVHLSESNKRQLKSYIESYLGQGYALDQLKSHLESSGWDPKLVDAVAKEMSKVI